jgi:ABC-type dipeptide/oligopeptide/nickel transport system ATPase component
MKSANPAETQASFTSLDWLLSIGMALTWGSSFLLIKIAIRHFDSSVIPLGRTAFGAVALLLIPSARKRIATEHWPRLLSLGEQQRLAFARLLLNSPRFVVLDEATSALDVITEKHLYNLLTQREMAFVSVGHRPTLRDFHDTVLALDGQGGWTLIPVASYDFNSGA